uniref:Uncharacterized protein n=1 Tax=Strombidium inclinatum TaxID=197538 RepID=A0A7S3IY14_9SPIT|mmetsp:Transcript_8521/g.13121  ORF Transcript_8521/g.13121 Transcript_8521/m.13121 type:complete len:175 (+) Transcript_8521:148-672(+)
MAFNQSVDVRITNNFENFEFDVLIFEVDESSKSSAYDCYVEAVSAKNWDPNCDFEKVKVYTKRDDEQYSLKASNETNDKDRIIVIDNTPIPKGGAQASDSIVLEYASSTTYEMQYNLRNVSIYMGIGTMVLLFAIGSLNYLSFKISRDIKRKFKQDEDEDSEEEEEEEDKDKEE